MKRELVEAMSEVERRVKTAEICGAVWVEVAEHPTWALSRWPKRLLRFLPAPVVHLLDGPHPMQNIVMPIPDANGDALFMIPDYLKSLDAMHEAEKVLKRGLVTDFDAALEAELKRGARVCDFESYVTDFTWHAKARQRNTAFLMVMLPDPAK